MCTYAMNLNDGTIDFNSEAVATNINYVELDDEVHAAIKSGKLDWQTVAKAVLAKRNNDKNFDWERFDFLRDRLNVRKARFDLKGTSDVTNPVREDGTTKPINPAVSFIELSRPDSNAVVQDHEGVTNVGGLSHPAEPVSGQSKVASEHKLHNNIRV